MSSLTGSSFNTVILCLIWTNRKRAHCIFFVWGDIVRQSWIFYLGSLSLSNFVFTQTTFCSLHARSPPVTALFVNLSTQPTMCQQKGSSICLSVFLCFLFFFKQPILRAILLFLIAILTQQLLQRILHTCGNNFTFSRLKLYLRQSSSFNGSRAFCCQDEGKII